MQPQASGDKPATWAIVTVTDRFRATRDTAAVLERPYRSVFKP